MELLIGLAMKFWQWSLLIAFVILGFAINLFDRKKPKCYTFCIHINARFKTFTLLKQKAKVFLKQ